MESKGWLVLLGLFATIFSGAKAATYRNTSTAFFSELEGPSMAAYSYTWSRYIEPTVIGTVEIIINTDTNRTVTTTKTKTEFANNGTIGVLTRTDTNAAGTVTAVSKDLYGRPFTAAYPTPMLQLTTDMTWNAILPTYTNSTTCCWSTITHSVTPTHTPFPSPTDSTDSADPSGWLYTLVGDYLMDPRIELDAGNISSLWSGQTIGIAYTGCAYTFCAFSTTNVAAASAVKAQAFLFDTATITTGGQDTSAAAAASPTAQATSSSVEVDPVAAGSASLTDPLATPTLSSSVVTRSSTKKVVLPTSGPNSQPGAVETAPTLLPQPVTPSTSSASSRVTSAPAAVEPAPTILPQSDSLKSSSTTSVGSPDPVKPAPTILPETVSPSPPSAGTTIQGTIVTAHLESSQSALLTEPPKSSQSTSQEIGEAILSIIQSGNALSSAGGGVVPQTQNDSPAPTTTNALSVLVEAQSSLAQAANNGGQNGGSSVRPTSAAVPAPIVVGSVTVTRDSSSNFVVQGQTLSPGNTVTIDSGASAATVIFSAGASGTIIQVGTSRATITPPSAPAANNTPPAIVVAGNTITADSLSQFVVSGQTLAPGNSITIGSGSATTVLALSTGISQTVLQIGTSLSTLPAPSPTIQAQPLTINGATITPDSSNNYIISSQTLSPGSSITLSGMVIALLISSTQTVLQVGTSRSTLNPLTPTTLPPLTIGSSVVTPNSASEYVLASQTLRPGGAAIIVDGTRISLASGGTALVVGTARVVLTSLSGGGGVGGYVWGGIGGSTTASAGSGLAGSSGSGVVTWSTGSGGSTTAGAAVGTSSTSAAGRVVGEGRWVVATVLLGLLAWAVNV